MEVRKRSLINDALRLVRLYWGLSQKDLAEKLDLSQSMISEIERGSKTVSMDVLERYSKNLGIRMSQLLFFAEELETQPLQKRGKLIVAPKILKILKKIAPNEAIDVPK